MRRRLFARCSVCTHAAVVREGAAAGEAEEPDARARALRPCAMCGGAVVKVEPPADLFTGWRCGCYACVATPC